MNITFATKRLQKLCNSEKELRGKFGPRMANVIQTRLADLEAAECLSTMTTLPGRCHELTSNLDGCLAVDLVHPDRLVFRPVDDPLPIQAGGGLDWAAVRNIQIVGIGDYH